MKTNLRGKIREFIASEAGRVGVKGPLGLGIATSSVLLAQAIVGTPQATAGECCDHHPCPAGKVCVSGSCVDS